MPACRMVIWLFFFFFKKTWEFLLNGTCHLNKYGMSPDSSPENSLEFLLSHGEQLKYSKSHPCFAADLPAVMVTSQLYRESQIGITTQTPLQ